MADKPKNEPGKFTTEFILVVVSNLIAIMGVLKGMIGPEITAIILAVLNAIYSIARTLRKSSADKKEVELKKIEVRNGSKETIKVV